jgi:hypothetical protein
MSAATSGAPDALAKRTTAEEFFKRLEGYACMSTAKRLRPNHGCI